MHGHEEEDKKSEMMMLWEKLGDSGQIKQKLMFKQKFMLHKLMFIEKLINIRQP
jgi:hypothetical protein